MSTNGLFRQPLVWFALIGLLLFVADSRLAVDRNQIVVSEALRERLATLWFTQTGLAATESEIDALVDNWIMEEVLYQEALRLGLDHEDSIVRRRLIQKLGFIAETEDGTDPQPGDLLAYYQANPDDYTLPIRYTFQQLYFASPGSAEDALEQIGAGDEARDLGESSMLNFSYAYRSALDLNATFGAGFADQLVNLETGRWLGPIRSGFGFHLIFVTAVHPEQVSPFEAVQRRVAQDYNRAQQLSARDAYIDNLKNEYSIIVETQ